MEIVTPCSVNMSTQSEAVKCDPWSVLKISGVP
jgi:hypothetical protein